VRLRVVIIGVALSGAVAAAIAGSVTAQQPASAAAAETKIAAPGQAQAADGPGWFARQWNTITGYFAAGPERGRAPTAGAPGLSPPPQVTASRPVVREIIEWDEYTGRFDAVDTIEVRARVSGFLNDVHFTDGQMVKKGDPLFSIDPRPFERALATARAELEQAKTKVENAMKDVVRGRPLVDRKVISEKVFDDRENLQREAEAAVKVAEAKVQAAELDLSFTKISAPLAGRIGRNLISVGNYVTGGGGGAGSQTLLATIVSQDPIQFYFDVSENNVIKYKRLGTAASQKVGQPGSVIEIALPDDKGFPQAGKLDFNDNRLDATTGTLRMRAIVDNADGLLSPGMFGRARWTLGRRKALVLPAGAVQERGQLQTVFVVEDGHARSRVVTAGPDNVVLSGLNPGEKVIAPVPPALYDGARVEARP